MLRKKIGARSQAVGAIFLLLFFIMLYRFYDIQAVEAAWYLEKAERMWNREHVLKAERGSIFDRNGETLATNATSYTVAAILNKQADSYVENSLETAKALSPYLDMSVESLHRLLSQEGLYQVELRPGGWKVDRSVMEAIKELKLPGIIFIEEPKRYYPNNDFASHVLGFINHDGERVMGLEAYADQYLSGEDGYIQFSKDARGNRLPQGLQGIVQAKDGYHLYLTLDERIQLYVEQVVDDVLEAYNPEKITVIVSDPHTGEILAMASRPSFNPNRYSEGIENYVNHAITSTYEPGSTFKIVTLAAAIEEGKFNPNETFMSGSYSKVPGNTIHDHIKQGWGEITFLEGVLRSSNVAFTILGWERLPKEVFYHYIERFGFGELTGIDLPNEKKGFLRPMHAAYPIDVATMTFGQGVAVTAIQQVAAVNAIANGGTLLKPYIISKVVDAQTGEIIKENKPTIVRDRVISKETAEQVSDLLEQVVTDGTGKAFYIEGYQVAGKTGTGQKVGPDGRYMVGKYIHNFIGFAPKDNPQLVIYVVVDSPEVNYLAGGSVVAQIFKPVMLNSLQYLKVHPQIEEIRVETEEENGVFIPKFEGSTPSVARQKAEQLGLDAIVIGDGSKVMKQIPEEGTTVYRGERLYLLTDELNEVAIPDFTGWSLRGVMDWARITDVDVKTLGTGYAFRQSKPAGNRIAKGEQLIVDFKAKHADDEPLRTADEKEASVVENSLEGIERAD